MRYFIFLSILSIVSISAYSQNRIIQRLDSLSEAYENQNYHGVVLVAKGDSVLYQRAYGFSNIPARTRLRTDNRFKTESTGKMYTAVSIMQLVEQKKLSTDQTIKEILPDLPVQNADKITVHHLLTHTSGLQSPWEHPQFSFKKVYSKKELADLIASMPLIFDTPGKEMYYSNSGYIILGWIIEKISGLSLTDYFNQNIFIPQGMKVDHLKDTVLPKGEPQPYRYINTKRYITMDRTIGAYANGAGGWMASASDLFKFMSGLDKNKFISSSTLKTMRTGGNNFRADSSYRYYGYGLENFVNLWFPGVSIFGHSGGGAGFSINALLEPVNHYIVIFCSNTYTDPRQISANYLRVLLDKPTEKVQKPLSIRLYDMIEEKGIADFVKNEKDYFKQLDVVPNERVFIITLDALEEAKDYGTMAGWAQLGLSYFPENGFLHLMAGAALAKTGNKEKASIHFEKARSIAELKKDTRLLTEIEKVTKLSEAL